MAVFDYITQIRNRLLLLLDAHDPTSVVFRLGNKSRPSDGAPYPNQMKPVARQAADYPSLTLTVGDSSDGAYGGQATLGDEDNAATDFPATVTQDFTAKVIHDAINPDRNNPVDLEVVTAWRKGRGGLADPNTPNSDLAYVSSWSVTTRRTEEKVEGKLRGVSRITIRVTCDFRENELNL